MASSMSTGPALSHCAGARRAKLAAMNDAPSRSKRAQLSPVELHASKATAVLERDTFDSDVSDRDQDVDVRPKVAPVAAVETAPVETQKKENGYKSGVCIVGGGPAGLATAMLLAKRGWTDITLIEARSDVVVEQTDRSYVYMLDGRGQKLFEELPGLGDKITEYAVSLENANLTTIDAEGNGVTKKLDIKSEHFTARWMPRGQLLKMLYDQGLVPAMEQGWGQNINIRTGTKVVAVNREATLTGGWQMSLTVEDSTGAREVLRPHLVVGADGLHSSVRAALDQWEREDAEAQGTKPQGRFQMQEYESPSAGLRYKVLRLPANPVLSTKKGVVQLTNPSMGVVAPRAGLPATRRIRLGLMPVVEGSPYRTANIIMPAEGDHDLLHVADAEGFYKYFEDVFPQLPVRELIPLEEATRFVSAKAGAFPKPQHVNALQMSCPADATEYESEEQQEPLQGYGVVLVGDARAAFPPDLAQGVNSAFEDVLTFNKVLEECGDNVTEALPRFEAKRTPEVKALVELMTFCFPYQYSQDMLAKSMWAANFISRMALSKLMPNLISPQSFLLVQDPKLSYTQVLDRAHTTTRRLTIAGCVLGASAVLAPLVKAAVGW